MSYVIKWKVWWDTRTYLHRLALTFGMAMLIALTAGFFVFMAGW